MYPPKSHSRGSIKSIYSLLYFQPCRRQESPTNGAVYTSWYTHGAVYTSWSSVRCTAKITEVSQTNRLEECESIHALRMQQMCKPCHQRISQSFGPGLPSMSTVSPSFLLQQHKSHVTSTATHCSHTINQTFCSTRQSWLYAKSRPVHLPWYL